jgi:hypothetical protein
MPGLFMQDRPRIQLAQEPRIQHSSPALQRHLYLVWNREPKPPLPLRNNRQIIKKP